MKYSNRIYGFLVSNPKRYIYCTIIELILVVGLAFCIFPISKYVASDRMREMYFIIVFVMLILTITVYIRYILLPVYNMQKTLAAILDKNSGKMKNICMNRNDYKSESIAQEIVSQIAHSVNLEYQLEIVKRQADVATLQGQINPHFLYNTLDCIRGQALLMGADYIADMTQALSKFFRYSISRKGDLVTVAEELQNVQNYFKIQQFRFNNRHSLIIYYDKDDMDILDCLLPKLTLQPIVENAILHGLERKVEQGTISISMISTGKCLLIRCADSGVGMNLEELEKLTAALQGDNINIGNHDSGEKHHSGIAMTNVNQRIKLVFGDEYGITVSSVENTGTDVDIRVPLAIKYDMENMEKSDERRSFENGSNRR